MRQAGYPDSHRPYKLCQIKRCSLAFNVKIRGQEDFFNTALLHPFKQSVNFQIVRTDTIQRRKSSM